MKKVFLQTLFFVAAFFSFHVTQAQLAPVKQWDRTFGGKDSDRLFSVQQTFDGGYIVGGDSHSRPSSDRSAPSRGGLDYWVLKLDANGSKSWDKAFGTIGYDRLNHAEQTFDGGYILGGWAP